MSTKRRRTTRSGPVAGMMALLLFAATFFTAGAAFAESDAKRMKRLSTEATEHYRAENYRDAAETFIAAYDAQPHPNLLKNAAVAWFHAGRCTEAIRWSTTFQQRAADRGVLEESDIGDMEVIRAKCAILDARSALAAQNFSLADEALQSVPQDLDHTETQQLYSEVQAEIAATTIRDSALRNAPLHPPTASARTTETDASASTGRGGARGWLYGGWVSIGLGAGLLATQGIVAAMLANDVRTVREFESRYDCEPVDGATVCGGEISEDERASWQGSKERVDRWDGAPEVLLVSAGATLAGFGIAMLVVHYLSREERVAVVPTIGRDGAGAAISFRF